MKRMLMTLAGVAGMAAAAGPVQADPGGFAPPPGYGSPPAPPTAGGGGAGEFGDPNTLLGRATAPSGHAPDRYGMLPGLRRAFRIGGAPCGAPGCATCGPTAHGHGGGYGYGAMAGAPPVNQGTLVFPNHTFARSPRDFFMYEPGR